MTYTANHPVDGDDIQTALSTYINQNITHIVAAFNQEHAWDAATATNCFHDANLFSVKIGLIDKDMTEANAATTVVTGVGFTSQLILFVTLKVDEDGTRPCISFGGATATGAANASEIFMGATSDNTLGTSSSTTYVLTIYSDSLTFQRASISAIGSDGFTLTWGKTGTPTGTARIFYLCLRFSASATL